jgi:hypothetical protein
MPLEVREIGIYLRVGEPDAYPQQTAPGDHRNEAPAHDTVVHDCVRRVLAILKTRQER